MTEVYPQKKGLLTERLTFSLLIDNQEVEL